MKLVLSLALMLAGWVLYFALTFAGIYRLYPLESYVLLGVAIWLAWSAARGNGGWWRYAVCGFICFVSALGRWGRRPSSGATTSTPARTWSTHRPSTVVVNITSSPDTGGGANTLRPTVCGVSLLEQVSHHDVGLMGAVVDTADRPSVTIHGFHKSLKAVEHLHLRLMEGARGSALEEVGNSVGALMDIVVDLHELG